MACTRTASMGKRKWFAFAYISDLVSELSHFAIFCNHSQLVTICHRFITLFFKPLFKFVPILSTVNAISKNTNNIHNWDIPPFPFCIPHRSDLSLFEQFNARFVLRDIFDKKQQTPDVLKSSVYCIRDASIEPAGYIFLYTLRSPSLSSNTNLSSSSWTIRGG